MFLFKTNESIKVIHIQKLAYPVNVQWRTFDINIGNSFRESKKNVNRLIKLGTF